MFFEEEKDSLLLTLAQLGCDQADRNLDAEIAKILGYKVIEYVPGRFAAVKNMNESFLKNPLPCYSGNYHAMGILDKEMQSWDWLLMLETFSDGKVKAFYWQYGKDECYPCVPSSGIVAIADTMPKAVALAAYHVLAGKEWV